MKYEQKTVLKSYRGVESSLYLILVNGPAKIATVHEPIIKYIEIEKGHKVGDVVENNLSHKYGLEIDTGDDIVYSRPDINEILPRSFEVNLMLEYYNEFGNKKCVDIPFEKAVWNEYSGSWNSKVFNNMIVDEVVKALKL